VEQKDEILFNKKRKPENISFLSVKKVLMCQNKKINAEALFIIIIIAKKMSI
jgi:hypothetical protein